MFIRLKLIFEEQIKTHVLDEAGAEQKKFHHLGIFSQSLQIEICFTVSCFHDETGSNLSLGTRLTVLSKSLGRKRCCDATHRCLEVCRHYLCFTLFKICFVFFQRSRVLVGAQDLKWTN